MDVNQKINSFTPQELATFLTNLNGFDIDFSIKIKPQSNELNTHEACEFLNVSPSQIAILVREDLIRTKKNKGKLVFYRDDLTSQRQFGLI